MKALSIALVVVPGTALAASIGTIANNAIDSVQTEAVDYIATAAGTLFFGFLTWVGATIRIKVVEHFNREAIEKGVKNFADSVIDELQRRYLSRGALAEPIDVSDLIYKGIDYVRGGNPDAVRQSGITDDRLGRMLNGAMNKAITAVVAK